MVKIISYAVKRLSASGQYICNECAAWEGGLDGDVLAGELLTEKNGFVTATKLGTTNKIFVAATKNFAAATKRFVQCFCYPYFNK